MSNKEFTYDGKKLDMRASVGCSYPQAKKEALITLIAYVIWGAWGIIIAGCLGYAETLTYIMGLPAWIMLGVVAPIFILVAWLIFYMAKIYKD